MQVHFIKNMTGVSIAALLFSTIGIKILADQVSANTPEETTSKNTLSPGDQSVVVDDRTKIEGSFEAYPSDNAFEPSQTGPNIRLSEDERAIVRNLLREESGIKRLSRDMQPDLLESTTLDTPAKRAAARVNALTNDRGSDATEWRHDDHPVGLRNAKLTDTPFPKKDQAMSHIPETMAGGNVHQVEAGANDFIEGDFTAEKEEIPVVYKHNNLLEPTVTLPKTELKAVVIRPNYHVVRPEIYGGDDENLPPQKEEDPDDPTSRGPRKGGQHKGTEVAPHIKAIPIIRMGEYNKENSGLTVIKPWNS